MVTHVIICDDINHAINLCERWFKYIKEIRKREITREIQYSTDKDAYVNFSYLNDPIWCEETVCEFVERDYYYNRVLYQIFTHIKHTADEIERILKDAGV